MAADRDSDILIIGGGPAGATAGLVLARRGFRVRILERTRFPRFHVGESFLPRGYVLLRELGLAHRLDAMPHMVKYGAEFSMGNDFETSRFSFDDGLDGSENRTFNIARAPFDNMILRAAQEAGVDVVEDTVVRKILRLTDGDAAVSTEMGEYTGRFLFDASGQATLVGRHLGLREVIPNHRKVAYFGHFENVERLEGREEGYPTVAICDEGWFWMIPIDERRTSIGLVMDTDAAKKVGVPSGQMLFWGVERCPLVRHRTRNATFPESSQTTADFSYTCRPYAGDGYFMVGDSAFFLDPIFSTGVCLGMMGAVRAAELAMKLLGSPGAKPACTETGWRQQAEAARKEYIAYLQRSSGVFFRLVHMFYDPAFRDLFLHGHGPLQVRRAVISILAGHVFPRPAWSLRWRLWMFEQMVKLQRRRELVVRRPRFSLLSAEPEMTAPETSRPEAAGIAAR